MTSIGPGKCYRCGEPVLSWSISLGPGMRPEHDVCLKPDIRTLDEVQADIDATVEQGPFNEIESKRNRQVLADWNDAIRFGYTIVWDNMVIGHCSKSYCFCVAEKLRPEGCLYFTPVWKQRNDPMNDTMSNPTRATATALVNKWAADWGSLSLSGGGALSDLIDRVTKALSPPVPPTPRTWDGKPVVDRYCVIGVDAYQRTWLPTLAEALDHAGTLFERGKDNSKKGFLIFSDPHTAVIFFIGGLFGSLRYDG